MASKNTLLTNSWDTVYTYIQTTNPISTNTISSSFNDGLVADKGYPIVIIEPPRISYNKLSFGGDFTSCEILIPFEVYEKTSQLVKSQADNVITKLLAGRSVFATAGYYSMELQNMGYDSWTEGKKKIHTITFDVMFRYVEN